MPMQSSDSSSEPIRSYKEASIQVDQEMIKQQEIINNINDKL